MNSNSNLLTMVFADIVGSSNLYSELGNERAQRKVDDAIKIMAGIVRCYHGKVVKTIGDEIMFVHRDPEYACESAVRMNREIHAIKLSLRTGICFGKVILDHRDIYGDTVNNAAYLAKTAQANQILLDSNTFANLALFRQKCEFFDRVTLKGQTQQSLIYRLNWEKHDTTSLDATAVSSKAISADNGIPTQMHVIYKGKSYIVDPNSQLVIGRDHGNVHISIQHKNASRKHCTISYHRRKFILQDYSTNGTYLIQENQQELFLRRESTPLQGKGKISIGQPCLNSEEILEYQMD